MASEAPKVSRLLYCSGMSTNLNGKALLVNTQYLGCRAWKNQTGNDPDLLTSFQTSRSYYVVSQGKEPALFLASCRPCKLQQVTCKTRSAASTQWLDGYRRMNNCALAGCEADCTGRRSCWCCGPASRPTAGGLVRMTIAVMTHHDQSNCGRTGLILLTVPCNSSSSKLVRAGTQAVRAGTWSQKSRRGWCLQACSSRLA